MHGWWVQQDPGQREELHLVMDNWGEVCHWVRESWRYTALAALDWRRPATFWGARGGGLHARLCPRHDGGQLGDGALIATSAASRGDVDRGTGPKASNFGFGHLPLLRAPHGDRGLSPLGLPAVANIAGYLAPAGVRSGSATAGFGPPVSVALVPASDGPVAGSIGQNSEVDHAGQLMYRLYGMYLAVLYARMGPEVAARGDAGMGPSFFAVARTRPLDVCRGYT